MRTGRRRAQRAPSFRHAAGAPTGARPQNPPPVSSPRSWDSRSGRLIPNIRKMSPPKRMRMLESDHLVSFDCDIRKRGCRTMMRTSQSGHSPMGHIRPAGERRDATGDLRPSPAVCSQRSRRRSSSAPRCCSWCSRCSPRWCCRVWAARRRCGRWRSCSSRARCWPAMPMPTGSRAMRRAARRSSSMSW